MEFERQMIRSRLDKSCGREGGVPQPAPLQLESGDRVCDHLHIYFQK
jgi:hypothetical protein